MREENSAVIEDAHDDVLHAYQDVLKKFKDKKSVAVTDFVLDNNHVEREASQHTDLEEMNACFLSLKTALTSSLDAMQENYFTHYQSWIELQERVRLLRNELHELHQIKVEHATLTSLIETHQQKKQACEQEFQSYLHQFEEQKKRTMREWREEEQRYHYERDLAREKERNFFEMEKRSLEQELTARRTEFEREMKERILRIELQEAQLANLERYKQALDRVPDEIRAQVAQAEATFAKQIQTQHYYEIQLLKKELELKDQMIATLEARIMHFDTLKNSFNQLMVEKAQNSL